MLHARQYLEAVMAQLGWSEEASTARQYLMRYPTYTARGWPIGSGQHGKGARMKRSGMLWSGTGTSQMAALRAENWSRRKMADFHTAGYQVPHPPAP